MKYFPLFVNIEGYDLLVIGGGNIASRKIKSLLPFKANIIVVADKPSEFIMSLSENKTIKLIKRKFEFSDIENKKIVIVAANDIKLQKKIYELCSSKNIPVNCVDNPSYCSFIFPSLITKDDLVIGISTSSKAPAVSKRMRTMIEKTIPDNIGKVIKEVARLRDSFTKGKLRQNMIKQIVSEKLSEAQFR